MSIQKLADSAHIYALPLKDEFRGTQTRVGVLFEGPSGWAEFAPFPEYSDEVAGLWLAGALEQAFGSWPLPVRESVPVNAIIPLVGADRTGELVQQAVQVHGMDTIKMKVADGNSDVAADLVRIQIARLTMGALGVQGKIRIDVNGAWTVDQAVERLIAFNDAAGGLDYVEQPCATLEELAQLKQRLPEVRVAVDESIRQGNPVDAAYLAQVADIAILKSIPLGGVHAAMRTARLIGLPVVVSGSLDTSVGLASGIALARSLPALHGACGLGTGLLLAQDVTSTPILPHDGVVDTNRVLPDRLMHIFVSQTVSDDWRSRIVRAWRASGSEIVSAPIREAVEAW
ncbi:MAG: o-succinylbenzoate synthase [Actinobacteria bacterium]|uniref:Unannotated protein n=1 Tax=freshwater metagenome TaxID=449393 RepID=A0A6J5YZJ0_9ZZZZ|nr:o-succinylbenzoate synthase [Actinomycetota bacterium]